MIFGLNTEFLCDRQWMASFVKDVIGALKRSRRPSHATESGKMLDVKYFHRSKGISAGSNPIQQVIL